MQLLLGKHWHHLSHAQALEFLGVDPERGLDLFDIQHRRERLGENRLQEKKKESPFVRFIKQFYNPLMLLLIASSVITAIVKDLLDAAIIFAAVLINAVISFLQESRAEDAIKALAGSLASETSVLRAGEIQRISAVDLVPGDIVLLSAGDRVPADMRIVASKGLSISEAALTGESVPAEKQYDLLFKKDTLLADRRNMAYASTLVTSGTGRAVVTATGKYTEIGAISEMIQGAEQLQTPLTQKIAGFSMQVMVGILALAGAVIVISLFRGDDLATTLVSAIALAVAMIPEGLPTALTVTLAIGVQRMARRRAIIRRLPAVEALGSTTVICTDKTGTLTQNQMTVSDVVTAGDHFHFTGSGYLPQGEILINGRPIEPKPGSAIFQILLSGLLCNDSSVGFEQGAVTFNGDPTEIALLVSAQKAGLPTGKLINDYARLDVLPFDSKNQYMATLHTAADGNKVAFFKGALEVILSKSSFQVREHGEPAALINDAEIKANIEDLASQGKRVLAFAYKDLPVEITSLNESVLQGGWVFLGLQAMIDPPRLEAALAVAACQAAGISVKMITGDHPLTAAAIARQIGILGNKLEESAGQIITGADLARLTDAELIEKVGNTNVFSRVSPDQKLRLVEALQARGHVVSMTGDGVNDGPALKQANIGIAMGITGTDVAKEASDMVLTDDNFATIESAVEEGRSIFDNIIKIISWTLPTNIGGGLIILVAMLLGEVLPIIPIQILWINMVTVGLLGIVLAMEDKEPGIMQRAPRAPSTPIITSSLAPRIFFVGFAILIAGFLLFEWELHLGASLETARTAAVNAVTFIEVFFLLNSRSLQYSPFKIGFFKNRWLIGGIIAIIGLQLLFTYAPFMNAIFGTAPLEFEAVWRVIAAGLFVFIAVEIEKFIRLKQEKKILSPKR